MIIMKIERFFMTADYIQDGIDKCEWFELAAPSEHDAINLLLNLLEPQGKDVQCIVTVMGINSIDELKDFVYHGPKPGTVCFAHVLDQ